MYLAASSGGGGGVSMLLMFGLMFVVFYFLLIRPQQRKQKQRNALLSSLKKGDKVATIGGIRGTIAEITDDTIILRVNDTTRITFERSAISTVLNSAPAPAEVKADTIDTSKKDTVSSESTL